MKNKNNATTDFINMILKSWTWEKLTEQERNRFLTLLSEERFSKKRIIGTYKQRYEILNGFYEMFLEGCGYKPDGWRE